MGWKTLLRQRDEVLGSAEALAIFSVGGSSEPPPPSSFDRLHAEAHPLRDTHSQSSTSPVAELLHEHDHVDERG